MKILKSKQNQNFKSQTNKKIPNKDRQSQMPLWNMQCAILQSFCWEEDQFVTITSHVS